MTGLLGDDLIVLRGGVTVRAGWRDALRLNLHSRLAQRVLIEVAHAPYRHEGDLYDIAGGVAWESWFTPQQRFKIETTAQHSPLKSLNFATLKIKDAHRRPLPRQGTAACARASRRNGPTCACSRI